VRKIGFCVLVKDVLPSATCDGGVKEEMVIFVYEEAWNCVLHNDLGVLATV
jgi:hypothetical protein